MHENGIVFLYKTMLCILLIIGCLVSKTIGVKRYDVEAEALKLYGEDIHDVIAKFRRTPDYLRILNSKIESLQTRMTDIMVQTHYHYDLKLRDKVRDLLGIQESDLEPATTPADTKDPATAPDSAFFRGSSVRYRRQGSKEATKADSSKQESESKEQKKRVKILDSYHKLYSTLTLAQKNNMKELGFEFAGHLIHSLIRSMGDDDVEVKSTRHPYGGQTPDSKIMSTRHVSVHEVTTLPTKPAEQLMSTLQAGMTKLGDRFAYRYAKP